MSYRPRGGGYTTGTMRSLALLLAALFAVPLAARADEEDLSGGEARRNRKTPTYALRAEAGSDFAPFGRFGVCGSYFSENPLGGAEFELGLGTGLPGVQIGLAVRQLFGDSGEYFAFELSVAGNTIKQLGSDPIAGHFQSSHYWSSLGVGFEHRSGFITASLIGALSFTTSLDLVPHPMVHGGLGFAF